MVSLRVQGEQCEGWEKIMHHRALNFGGEVTTCSQATSALKLLRERKGCFDIVLSDVHMPDLDGFKLLELVGLEMDLPVIMMSADGRTNLVMRGVRHGACDYLIKPIREEELKNIWQHVVRKRWSENKEHENSGGLEDNDRHKRGNDDAEYASSVNEGADGVSAAQKKRKDAKGEDEAELECDDPATAKKPRVVWSVELHQQFVSAVNQLGIDKAVPKRILELMNVPGLTRENVASHLQKFRLYLKRLNGVAQQQGGLANSFCGPLEANSKLGSLGRFDIQALAASGYIPPQTLAALHIELFNRSAGTLVLPISKQPPVLQGSLQGAKCVSDQIVAYSQPLMKCPSNISKSFVQSTGPTEDITSGIGMWPSKDLGYVLPSSKVTGLIAQPDSILLSMVQNQQEHQSKQQEQHEIQYVLEPSRSINVQPSCVVVPSNTQANFQAGSPASVNQNCSFSSSVMDYGILSPESHNSSAVAQLSTEFRQLPLPSRFSGGGSASPSRSCGSAGADNIAGWQVPTSSSAFVAPEQLSSFASNISNMQGSYNIKSGQLLDHAAVKNIGIANKVTSIPSHFTVNEPGLLLGNLNHEIVRGENSGRRIKQEPKTDFTENTRVGITTLQHVPANDPMGVLSD